MYIVSTLVDKPKCLQKITNEKLSILIIYILSKTSKSKKAGISLYSKV